jgi:hypothetical protein
MSRRSLHRRIAALAAAAAFVPLAATAPAHAAAGWFEGNSDTQSGSTCFGGPSGYGQITSNSVAYWTDPAAGYPAIGDKYWIRITTGAIGFGCPGGIDDVGYDLVLPAGTRLAIDLSSSNPDDKVRCFGYSSATGKTFELTDQLWNAPWDTAHKYKYCDSTKLPSPGSYGVDLGYRMLAQGQSFWLTVPVVSTKPLRGMAQAGNEAKAMAAVTSSVNTLAAPYQWETVFDRAAAVSYGADAVTGVTDTTAKTTGILDSWFRPGKVYVDIGEGTGGTYTSSAGPFTVDDSSWRWSVDQAWTGLTPGTDYSWRVRFVDSSGATTAGEKRTFRTTGTRPATGGGGPVAGGGGTGGTPGGTTGGGSTGGTGGAGGSGGGTPPAPIPAPSPAPVPPPPVTGDTTAPKAAIATVAAPRLRALAKGMKVGVTCDEACTLAAQLTVDARTAKALHVPKRVLATGSGRGVAGRRAAVVLRVPTALAKRLAVRRSLTATLVVRATDAAHNTGVRSVRVKLRR